MSRAGNHPSLRRGREDYDDEFESDRLFKRNPLSRFTSASERMFDRGIEQGRQQVLQELAMTQNPAVGGFRPVGGVFPAAATGYPALAGGYPGVAVTTSTPPLQSFLTGPQTQHMTPMQAQPMLLNGPAYGSAVVPAQNAVAMSLNDQVEKIIRENALPVAVIDSPIKTYFDGEGKKATERMVDDKIRDTTARIVKDSNGKVQALGEQFTGQFQSFGEQFSTKVKTVAAELQTQSQAVNTHTQVLSDHAQDLLDLKASNEKLRASNENLQARSDALENLMRTIIPPGGAGGAGGAGGMFAFGGAAGGAPGPVPGPVHAPAPVGGKITRGALDICDREGLDHSFAIHFMHPSGNGPIRNTQQIAHIANTIRTTGAYP